MIDQHTECHSVNEQVMDEWQPGARARITHLVHFLGRLAYKGLGRGGELMEADIRIHIFLHYVVGYGKAAGAWITKHKKIMSLAVRLMPLLHLYMTTFFTLTKNSFAKNKDRMHWPRFFLWEWLRFAILPMLSFSGSKVCSRWLNYVEIVNINLRFCHIFTSSHHQLFFISLHWKLCRTQLYKW